MIVHYKHPLERMVRIAAEAYDKAYQQLVLSYSLLSSSIRVPNFTERSTANDVPYLYAATSNQPFTAYNGGNQ